MYRRLRVAVIGTGFIGKQHIEALRRIPNIEVAAIVENNEETAKRVSDELGIAEWYTDYHEILEGDMIEVIHNCTPSVLHFPINRDAILMGKHVYCEKPLTLNAVESEELVKLAEQHDVALGVNFNYRHNAMVQEMHQLVKDEQVGRVLMLSGEYLQDWLLYDTDYDWRLDSAIGGNSRAVSDIGSHCFDTIQFIMGKRIQAVYAQLLTVHPIRRQLKKYADGTVAYENIAVNSEDAAFIMGKFEDGTPFTFNISQVSAGKKNALNLTVSGSNALLEWHQQQPDLLHIGHRDKPNEVVFADQKFLSENAKSYANLPAGHAVGWHDAFTNAINAYYKSIFTNSYRNKVQNYATFETGHEIMKLVNACLESNKNNQWVNV